MDNGIGYRAVHRMVVVDNRMWILTVRLPRAQDKEKTRKANNKENRTRCCVEESTLNRAFFRLVICVGKGVFHAPT